VQYACFLPDTKKVAIYDTTNLTRIKRTIEVAQFPSKFGQASSSNNWLFFDDFTLFVCGGKNEYKTVNNYVYSINAENGAIIGQHDYMNEARMHHGIYRVMNWVYVFGGRNKTTSGSTKDLKTAERYSIRDDSWSKLND
jgi:hypothetical protein